MEHVVRRPVESRRAYEQRRKAIALGMVLALSLAVALAVLMVGCGSVTPSPSGPTTPATAPALSASDVQNIVQAAAQAADSESMVIGVVDRGGSVLAVYRKPDAGASATGNFGASVNVNDLGWLWRARRLLQQRSGSSLFAYRAVHQRDSLSVWRGRHG